MSAPTTPNTTREPTARMVREAGYDGCVEISNATARVVLEPNLGGRVLRYAREGREALHQEPAQEGVLWDGAKNIRHPSGGRFDIGPEYGGVPHAALWLGRWTAELTRQGAARLTSAILPDSGLQVAREFTLGRGAHLRCTQIMRNHGPAPLRVFHWSRTFLPGEGLAFAPLPHAGRYPHGYAVGGPGGRVNFLPEPEPNVRVRDHTLELIGPPRRAKFVLDVDPGWLAYVAPDGLLFVKKFPVDPRWSYGEPTGNNASIWYCGKENTPEWPLERRVVEIEAIGPLEILPPGGEASFTEDWWLTPFSHQPAELIDLARLRAVLEEMQA